MAIIRLIVTLKFPLCKRAMMWRYQHQVGLILHQPPTVGPTYQGRRTTSRLPHDDTLPRQKPPASPEQRIVLIPYDLFSPIETIDTT